MEQEHQKQNEINYSVEVEKDGRKYVQSLAHQLAAYLCKQHFEQSFTVPMRLTQQKPRQIS